MSSSTSPAGTSRRGRPLVGQVVLTVVTLAVLVPWALLALGLFFLRCLDVCEGDQAGRFRYTGQALVAGPGLALAVVALVLGFTGRRRAFLVTYAVAVALAIVWGVWVLGGSAFF